ncbi:hypothetical protein F4818DRAFT_452834 [Hypoxylon cercidicola]|nr:hypothetical protein F4818DRAFT_452834 [Hypoxylon cercidicola]
MNASNDAQPNGAPNDLPPNAAQPNGAQANPVNNSMVDTSELEIRIFVRQHRDPEQRRDLTDSEAQGQSNSAPQSRSTRLTADQHLSLAAFAPSANRQRGRVPELIPSRATTQTPAVRWSHDSASMVRDGAAFHFVDQHDQSLRNEVRQINNNLVLASVDGPQAFTETTARMGSMFNPTDRINLLVYADRRPEARRRERRAISRQNRLRDPLAITGSLSNSRRPIMREPSRSQQLAQAASARASQPSQPRCANCHRTGHLLHQCVTNWDVSGDIPGCYRCNLLNHTIDECAVQPPIDDENRYYFEVTLRAGLPPLRSTRGWNQLAIEYGMTTMGPISRQRMIRVPYNHFDTWNYEIDAESQSHLLIQDEATADEERVKVLADQGYRALVFANSMDNRAANAAANSRVNSRGISISGAGPVAPQEPQIKKEQ